MAEPALLPDPPGGSVPARLTVLSGPSGVGKGTVVESIRRSCPQVWLSVSVTTRRPRPGEADGREYHFVSDRRFDELADAGELLEWASFAGHRYGTPRGPVTERLAAGVPVLLEVDVAGARQVRAAMPGALLVFLAPPSWEELVRRLTGRDTESADGIGRRLDAARDELQAESEFDITLVNASVEDVSAQLVALVTATPATTAHRSIAAARGRSHRPAISGGQRGRGRPVIGKADRGRNSGS